MYSFKLTQGADLAEGVVVDFRLPENFIRLSIGRDPSNQWAIPDRTLAISARHCEIVSTPNGPALRDVSTNGTFVNGANARLSGSHLLRDGDRIALGPYQITVYGPKAATAPRHYAATELDLPITTTPAMPAPAQRPAAAWRGGDPAAMLAQGDAPAARVGVTEILRNAPPVDDLDTEVTKIRVAPPKPPAGAGDARAPRPAAAPAGPAPATPAKAPPPAQPALTEPMPLEVLAPPLTLRTPGPRAAAPAGAAAASEDLLRQLSEGLGLPPGAWAGRDPAEVLHQVGALARSAVIALTRLLEQQAQSRRQIGSRSPALRQVRDLNPLRVATSPEAALASLLAHGADPEAPVQRASAELSAHQDRLMAAFRGAAQRLGDEMAPESLESAVGDVIGAARAAQRWDVYTGLWQGIGLEPGQPWSKGFVDAAMLHLGVAYDEQGKA